MKLLILQEKLKEGLNIIERISMKSLILPILNNTLLKTEKNFLKLSATDLEIGINWWSLAKIEKEGEIVLPIRVLSNFFNLVPNKQVSLEKKDQYLIIECENFKTQIKGFSQEDFPVIPQISQEDVIELEIDRFCQGLSCVVDVALPSQVRPEISGVYFSFQKDQVKLTTTDSFRLSEKTLPVEKKLEKEVSFILPQKTAKEIINIFNEKEGKLKIYFSPNQVLFENQMTETPHPHIQLMSKLIEGEYPNYQEIIPKKYQTQVVLNKQDFFSQIKLASLLSGKINEVKLKISPKKSEVEILSQNPELGEHHSVLKGKINGESLEVSFNYKFLLDGLLNIKTPEVSFELSKEEGPAVLKPVDDPNYLYVVMPIKSS